MWEEAIRDEFVAPSRLGEVLAESGLVGVKINAHEFYLADAYGQRFGGLSVYDRVALAIAKVREIPLLTGDRRLRNAATSEGVAVMGTLGVVDRLLDEQRISHAEYESALRAWERLNGGTVRLPADELAKRLRIDDTSRRQAL